MLSLAEKIVDHKTEEFIVLLVGAMGGINQKYFRIGREYLSHVACLEEDATGESLHRRNSTIRIETQDLLEKLNCTSSVRNTLAVLPGSLAKSRRYLSTLPPIVSAVYSSFRILAMRL